MQLQYLSFFMVVIIFLLMFIMYIVASSQIFTGYSAIIIRVIIMVISC